MESTTPLDGAIAVSIVVPHYNDLQNLRACLTALADQSIDPSRYEVIVADNNSTCDRSALETLCGGNIRLIDAPLQGAAEARNAGVELARAPSLAFIDSDCVPHRFWLAGGLRALEGAPLVGGRIDVAVDNSDAMTPTESFERIFAFNNERYIREEKFSVTANMFTTRAVFDHVGGFRNGVSEDRDWGQRAAALGYAWHYAPEALLEHPARRTWLELRRKWKRLTREAFTLGQERGASRATWLARHWLVALSIPVALVSALGSVKVPLMRDRLKGASVMVRLRLWRLAEAHRLAIGRSEPKVT